MLTLLLKKLIRFWVLLAERKDPVKLYTTLAREIVGYNDRLIDRIALY